MQSVKTVFIADDDKNLVDALCARCEDLGLKVRTAFDGLDVIVSVVSDPPDLLLLDVNMPGSDGLCVAEKVVEYQSFNPYPIILLTGRSDPLPQQVASDLDAHFVRKDSRTWEKLRPLILELLGAQDGKTNTSGLRSLSRKMRSSADVVSFEQKKA